MIPFSVLLSVYKLENPMFLKTSLESIWNNQSLKPTEIIIVKDGPLTIDLDAVITNFNKIAPLKIVSLSQNKGLGNALNIGLKNCSNEIVFRMDSDDIAKPSRFEEQVKIFNKKTNKAVIIGSNIREFNIKPYDLSRIRSVPSSYNLINNFKFHRNPFNHMTVGFLKSVILAKGGYKEMPGYEDYYLWMRVLKDYKGINLTSSLVHARVGNNMIGRRQGYKFFKNELRFQKQLFYEGLTSLPIFIKNIFLRAMPRLLPQLMLELIYKKFLRK